MASLPPRPKPWETASSAAGPSAISKPSAFDNAVASSATAPPPPPSQPAGLSGTVATTVQQPYQPRYAGGYGVSPYGGGGYGSYSSYSSPYNRLGYGGAGYGGYGAGYGGMGYGVGGLGAPGENPNLTSSLQQSTAPAFQVLESLVTAFTSLAQLVESTYMATHSSFFAMVGVADQLGSLKTYLGQVLGVFSLLRLGRGILNFLRGRGVRTGGWANEWARATVPGGGAGGGAPRPSAKPLVVFLLSAVGLPWLMTRLVRLLIVNQQQQIESQMLDPSKLEFARAKWAYRAGESWELGLGDDEIVAVLERRDGPEGVGWWRGRTRDGRIGWFPGNYAANFLPIPPKRADPLPTFAQQLLTYISTHFRDAHPDSFKADVNALVAMRKEWVEPKAEAHPEIAKGLLKYHAQLAFVATKFPSNISLVFAYHAPFPQLYSLTPDAAVALPSFTFERASVLFNIAAVYASLAAAEQRSDAEGIKRALNYLSSSAGVLDHIVSAVLPVLKSELSSSQAAGYDMTESFLTALREFVLAEAQECFWQQAVLQGKYKHGVIAKLSMKVSEYYKAALAAANGTDTPTTGYFPPVWIGHIVTKQMHFEAAAQYRLSQEDLEKARYGEEIARLRAAEALAKKGLDSGKKNVSEAVLGDLRNLAAAVKTALERAVRDNDLVYVAPVPPINQLAPIAGAGMVKLAVPPEVAEPIAWLMSGGAGVEPLFAALVPYGVHLALSIYDDRRDTLIRELDGRREELDGIAASTLQSLNLPGSIQALERPVGLPPSLLRKAEEVEAAGGSRKVRELLVEVSRLARGVANLRSDVMDVLDQEAHESEQLVERRPQLAESRPPSHVANQHLVGMAQQYDETIKQAAGSDATVRAKWEEWRPQIEILEQGEDVINDHVPSTSGVSALPPAVRPLRALLEQLDDRIANRAAIVVEARHVATADDVRPEVLQEASRLAHGGSGDVDPSAFAPIFENALAKYDRFKRDVAAEASEQERLLDDIRAQNDAFLAERKVDPTVKAREQRLQEMDAAYWKWREIVDNAEEGIKFYHGLGELLRQLKEACVQFLNARRADVGGLTAQLQHVSINNSPALSPVATPSAPSQLHSPPLSRPGCPPSAPAPPPPAPSALSFSLAHPSSAAWQSGADFLPPPPPPPILRSGGVQTQPRAPPPPPVAVAVDSPRRVTRSQAGQVREAPIGDPERNPYKKGNRRGGEGVV
ncbi:pH-response regulator protein palA/rim20 [Cryptotrichosporon argae]